MMRISFIIILVLSGYIYLTNYDDGVVDLIADTKKPEKKQNQEYSASIKSLLRNENVVFDEGVVYLINFWASWCSPCMRELPSLNRLVDTFDEKKLKILTINSDYEEQEKHIAKTKKVLGLKIPVISDIKGAYVGKFNVEGLPVTMIFKGDQLIEKINGEVDFDSNEFRKKIAQLLESSKKN